MEKARAAGRRRRAAPALPSVEADVMMVAIRRQEHRLRTVALRDVETEHITIESRGPGQVGDLEMHVTDTRTDDRRREGHPPMFDQPAPHGKPRANRG